MMTYREAIDFLFTALPMFQRVGGAAYKADLENTYRLDEYFHSPHRKFKTIHVAGTNGKGSTSHMLAAILQCAGYKTGLYTSPHLLDFRERIRIDGEMIPEQEVVDFVGKHRPVIRRIQPSFFEMTVAMAFDYFSRQEVDVAVIEVGMGGRLDSTNIITPLVSVITNISRDHAQFLGNSLAEIASEKAGIIKPGVPVVIGESQPESAPVFKEIAIRRGSPIVFADRSYRIDSVESFLQYQCIKVRNVMTDTLTEYRLDLTGNYQEKNIVTVLQTMDVINTREELDLPRTAVQEGLSRAAQLTGLSGRWQVLRQKPLVVADTGHNQAGIREITDQLKRTVYRKLFLVFGVVSDKELTEIWPILPRDAYYLFTRARIERALDAALLGEQGFRAGLAGEVVPEIHSAIGKAIEMAAPEDMIFIGGSTFTVAEALEYFNCEDVM